MPRSICLKSRPGGTLTPEHFEFRDVPDEPPGDGDVLLSLRYLSVDPYLRNRMDNDVGYTTPFAVGAPVANHAVAEVNTSNNPDFAAGDMVMGFLPWQDRVVARSGSDELASLEKIDTDGIPETAYLGILGMPGQTAWTGLKGLADPKPGETVFVSAASGAVGSAVGQIAKNLGCRAVGSAGSDDKVAYLIDELGFDGAFNYRTETDLDGVLHRHCPDGIDVNFENVGGPVSDAAFRQLNERGRMIICGLIAQYQTADDVAGPPLKPVLEKSLRIEGFIQDDRSEHSREWRRVGAEWLREGKLVYRESIVDGLENAPAALISVLAGGNFGKQLVRL